MKKKITIGTIFKNLDAIVTGSTLSLCVILVNINVIMRKGFASPIPWCEEVVTSLFVWTVFIGSAYAHRRHAHLGVDILVNLMHGKTKALVQDVMTILEILILVMLTWISAQYAYNLVFSRGVFKPTLTDTLRIPKVFTGMAVPIGFGLSLMHSIKFLLRDRLHILKSKPEEEVEEWRDEP